MPHYITIHTYFLGYVINIFGSIHDKIHFHLPPETTFDIVLMHPVDDGYEMMYGSIPSLCIEASTSKLKSGG